MNTNGKTEPTKDDPTPPANASGDSTVSMMSNEVTAKRRRSAIRDAKTIAITRGFSFPSPGMPHDSSVGTDNPPLTDSIQASKAGHVTPPWEHTTDLAKVTFANRVLVSRGGFAFSLNLTPAVVMAANENRQGFCDYMTRSIRRALQRAFNKVPDYWSCVHVTKGDRPHLHGAISVNDNELVQLNSALKDAGGEWQALAKQRQLKLRRLECDGWVRYVFRDEPKSRRSLSGRVITITKPLRAAASKIYGDYRSQFP